MNMLTPAHLLALAKFVAGLPTDDLAALLTGTATADDVIDLAEKAGALIAAALPPAALAAGEADLALAALKFLLDARGLGSAPFHIEAGQPDIAREENPQTRDWR